MKLPKSHPRYKSLKTRDLIVKGVERGITSIHGLIAQGRGRLLIIYLEKKQVNLQRNQSKLPQLYY